MVGTSVDAMSPRMATRNSPELPKVFPRVSSALILADGVGVNSWILGYLIDLMGVILRDRKTQKGELCSLRDACEAED